MAERVRVDESNFKGCFSGGPLNRLPEPKWLLPSPARVDQLLSPGSRIDPDSDPDFDFDAETPTSASTQSRANREVR
jgi:hypothetical protein